MRYRATGILAAVIVALHAIAATAHAGFVGHTVHLDFRLPDFATVNFDFGNAVVGPGVEFNTSAAAIDLTDLQISFDFVGPGAFVALGPFNGFKFNDALGTIPDITAVSINSNNMGGFTASDVSFDANNIFLNFNSTGFDASTLVVLDVAFAPSAVPAPASLMLVALGLIGITAARRWRRAPTTDAISTNSCV